jgi:hypothetical protein
VKALHESRDGEFVFAGQKSSKPLSVMALEMVLRRMKVDDVTVHGFRSAFRDWAAECTNFTNEVCEAALAHLIENKVEAFGAVIFSKSAGNSWKPGQSTAPHRRRARS